MSGQNARTIVLLAIVLVLGLGAGAWFLLYSPLVDDKASADLEADEIEARNDLLDKELRDLRDKRSQLPELEAQLEAIRAEFPTGPELSEFTYYLADLVRQSNAHVQRVRPDQPVQLMTALALPAGPGDYAAPVITEPPPSLYQYHFSIEIIGTWPQALKYLELLQGEDARMFLVTQVSASPPNNVPTDTVTGVFEYEIQGYTYALVASGQLAPEIPEQGGNDE
ncbi:MAG: hypothetical protein LBJ62_04065 [Bifidobacteriaceae bacterium]|jgi:hypothetical protein|nr:hypothetical protein [Bifidobacteriaceae bacterium]